VCSLLRIDVLNAIFLWRDRQPAISRILPESASFSLSFDGWDVSYRYDRRELAGISGRPQASPKECPMSRANGPPPNDVSSHRALWLSPLEAKIVATLAEQEGDEYTSAEEIGKQIGESCTGDFRAILRNLVARKILESGSGPNGGYRLARPADA
jgi:hypothetical protein